jgi:hypothetical protein
VVVGRHKPALSRRVGRPSARACAAGRERKQSGGEEGRGSTANRQDARFVQHLLWVVLTEGLSEQQSKAASLRCMELESGQSSRLVRRPQTRSCRACRPMLHIPSSSPRCDALERNQKGTRSTDQQEELASTTRFPFHRQRGRAREQSRAEQSRKTMWRRSAKTKGGPQDGLQGGGRTGRGKDARRGPARDEMGWKAGRQAGRRATL